MLGSSEGSQCSTELLIWGIGGGGPLDGELSGNNMESLTMEGNMFGECQAPCMLKTSFVDFYKE